MSPQPLTVLNTLPAFIAAAPPVIGVSPDGYVKIALKLDHRLTDIAINPRLLQSPRAIRVILLETLHQAQELRVQQIHQIIAQHSHIAQLDLLDVEATLLSIKQQQTAVSQNRQGVGRNHQGEINRVVLNSARIVSEQQLERSIFSAAQQSYEQIRNLQKSLPFPYLGII